MASLPLWPWRPVLRLPQPSLKRAVTVGAGVAPPAPRTPGRMHLGTTGVRKETTRLWGREDSSIWCRALPQAAFAFLPSLGCGREKAEFSLSLVRHPHPPPLCCYWAVIPHWPDRGSWLSWFSCFPPRQDSQPVEVTAGSGGSKHLTVPSVSSFHPKYCCSCWASGAVSPTSGFNTSQTPFPAVQGKKAIDEETESQCGLASRESRRLEGVGPAIL